MSSHCPMAGGVPLGPFDPRKGLPLAIPVVGNPEEHELSSQSRLSLAIGDLRPCSLILLCFKVNEGEQRSHDRRVRRSRFRREQTMSIITAPRAPDTVEPPSDPPTEHMSQRNKDKAHSLGITSATGLVVGSIVGTGVFTMPAVWRVPARWVSRCWQSWLSAQCSCRSLRTVHQANSQSDGGLYAYSRHEFGDFAGFLVGWCYWVQSWAGNAAIVASWVFYVDALFRYHPPTAMENWSIALVDFGFRLS